MKTTRIAARRSQAARDLLFVRCPRRVRRALGWHRRRGHGVAFTRFALLAGAVLGASPLWANPTGAQVVAGQVNLVSSVPATLNIHQGTQKAIIHWQSFSIGSGETVNFHQPSADSVTLNRVLGNDPSAIFGRLTANGTVMLVNPNGVVFGPTARVDVGGLVASTANLRDDDFLAGRYRFGDASANAQARIDNAGEISIRDSGLAALVAPRVHNSGVIQARLGRVVLGGAARFTLDFQGDGLLSFSAGDTLPGQVLNTGTLRADGGTVWLGASAVKGVVDQVINTSGVISATTVSGTAGRIVLSGGQDGEGGTVAVGGTLQAGGDQGGMVVVNAAHVKVDGTARIDVSGRDGGGEIALGSAGRASGYAHKSETTTVAAGAQLKADALVQGDGGHVTLWSEHTTTFAGSLSARGGAQGGNGGFAEVSSHKNIGLAGQVDLRAPHGASGTLLLDPTDLRITDSPSGGSQDGNASDNSVGAGDANQGSGPTLNTVSRGLLEGLSGNASIVLQATGQITIDAMAGGVLNLATTTGHGFTLQSTQTGGIRFADAGTEIRTQGGSITLEATGLDSSLSNIGRLSTNGGDITLKSSGSVELAGALNAGSGTVAVQSSAGSIANKAATSPLLSGGTVSLSAPVGHVGLPGQAIATRTTRLVLETGGHAVAGSDTALSSLSLSADHVAPTDANTYAITAPGLTLQMSDGAEVDVTQVTQAGGLDLTLSTDRSLQLGTVNVGTGSLSLESTGGNLVGNAGTLLSAATTTLRAQGGNGNDGAIGTAGQALQTATAHLDAVAGSGGAYVANTGALALDRLAATGSSSITASGTLTAGNVSAGSATLALGASGGSVLDDGDAATRITAGTLSVTAGGAIGSAGTHLTTSAGTLNANAGAGGVYLDTTATNSVLSSIVSGNGAIDMRTGGSTTLTSLVSSTSQAGHDISVTATGTGSMSVGTVNAGAAGDVTLTTSSGSISGNSGLITGDTVTLHAATSGSVSARTAASHLDVRAGSSSISITQTGSVTLDRIATPSTVASVTVGSGDITVGNVSTSTSGQVSLTASAGAILDDGDAATRITTGTAVLSAGGAIGSAGDAVQTRATGLTVTATGDLFVSNEDATLTSLSVTHRHATPGVGHTLQITSPYLTFDVTDDGTRYALDRVVSVPLGSLAFNGDQTVRVGQVQATGSVSLTATQGSLVDDGNLNSRTTSGSTLTLSAAQGSVGSAANPMGVNASSLSLTTRGDLYVSNLADMGTLTVNSSHPDTTTSYGMAITAPSFRLAVTDSAGGHAVHTLTDTSSLSLTFTSDRDITLGQVDLTNTGTARFTSSAGAIKDDGDKDTRVLANSTTLSGSAVGATGTGHLDVVTGTLAASASAGGVYVEVPMPTGSTNTTSTVTLGTITAAGPVAVTALEGDLSLGGAMTATGQPVTLTAAQGSILSPSGFGIQIGSGSLTLDAAQSIGTSSRALPVTSSAGATLTAQAGTSMFVSGSGPMTLSSLAAGTGITYTQSSGAITVGHVDATAGGTVALTATTGNIQNDADNGTGIRAQQVTLSAAQGSIGSGTALAVDTPQLRITANGTIAVDDSATLDTLSVTRGSGSSGSIAISGGAGQTFTLSEDGAEHHLQQVQSTTPLAFSFSGQRNVKVGSIDVGAAGSASIGSAASVVDDGVPGSTIAAGTVSLTAGAAGSIGASGSGIALEGTTALTLSAGRDFFVASDAALADLAITSTNTTTAVGTASVFGVSGLGQTFAITDSGTTYSLDYSGTALANAGFTASKNIEVGTLTATGDVTLSTSGGGANSNISSDGGGGRIAGNRVLLTASSSTAGGGSIGSSGALLRVATPTLILAGSAHIYVNDAQNLARLDMTVTHGTDSFFGYSVSAGNLNSFTITDGSTQSLGLAVSGAMDFSYSVDRALSLSTIDAGTSTTGSISLTSRSAPSGTGAQINRSSGSLTGGSITLSATGTNGGVGAGATLSTNTKNLSIASGGNVSVSNSTTLTSLALDARHNTSGSSTHSYSISSTGLTFSISDTLGNNAFQLSNVTQNGLDLTIRADRVITASSVNTGAGGSVTLQSGSYVQGGSGASAGSPSITTGDLTLNGGSAFGYQGSTPLYTAAGTLSSSLSNTLYLSNRGALTLLANTVAGSADVASTNHSLLQGAGGLFTTPTLKLSADLSLGSTGTLLTDARRLTLVSRGHIDVANASDLHALTITSTHGTPGNQNSLSVAAPRLALNLSDSVGGSEYHLSNLVDSSGLDFTLSTDVALNLGTVDVQAGRALALYSTGTGTAITNDGGSLLRAGSITLSASDSVGAAGGSGTRMQTDAPTLAVTTGANAYVDNAQDLSDLSLTSSQTAGGTAPVYQVSAPALSFDVTDDGTTHLNRVADSTGLNFVLDTRRDQAVQSVDLGRSGTVSLTSAGDILGDADSSQRISAGSATFYASNGGALGSVGNPLRLSAPLLSFAPTGALNVESDTRIDSLAISTTHPTVTYGGAYSIVSVPISGAAYALFTATDSVTGTALTSLDDPLGLAFSFTSDRAIQVGTLNLGTTGTVSITGTGSGGILGDGDPNTLVQAASLNLVSYGGAVGATGSGNGIDATVNAVSATAQGGGVNLALHGRATVGTISATGGVGLTNDEGDIALGLINTGGNAVVVNNQGGSIVSGSIANATTVSLTASGSIGNTSAIGTSANGGGTTTLTASASAAHGASGSIAVSESYNLAAASVTAPSDITLNTGYDLSAGTVTSGGAVALDASQGSITGIDGSNAITGTSVSLSARYGSGNGIGSSGTRLNLNTPQLEINTPGSVYVTDSADLNRLTVDRTDYMGTGSSGTLSIIATGLTFSATDSANTTTLTTLSDGTGLDFSYLGIGSLAVGSLNVGSGSVLLQAYLSGGDGHIDAVNGSSLITAGSLNLQAYGTGSRIGSSGTPLGLAVGTLSASSGSGGMVLRQAGALELSTLSTTGDLAVTATTGDLTLGTLSYGSGKTLSLTASGGRILAGGGTLVGSNSSAGITLSAADGIGTELAPVLVNASAGHTVAASVTGSGSLYLSSLGTLNGGLTTAVHDGATVVTAAGSIRLTSMTTGTDAAGNDIRVTAASGDITAVLVSGGASAEHTTIDLSANAGRLLAAPGATLEAFDVRLHGATGVGASGARVAADGQRVQVSSDGGDIYLTAATPAVLSAVRSNGGDIDITHADSLQLANALTGGGSLTVDSNVVGAQLIAGNLDAGAGSVSLSARGAGSTIVDDGNRNTAISGAGVTLDAAGGIGSSGLSLQTDTAQITATSGNGIHIDDGRAAGVQLVSVVATAGDVNVGSAGDMTVGDARANTNSGSVTLRAAGDIQGATGTSVTAHTAVLDAGGAIGGGSAAPLVVALSGGALTLGSGGAAAVSTAGNLDVSGGVDVAAGDLYLSADGLLTLPEAGITTTGAVTLVGGTDLRTDGSGAAARQIRVTGSALTLDSGAAGGSTTLLTAVGSLQADLRAAGNLTVDNTGTLASTTLSTSNGDISATSSVGLTATSVVAGGSSRSIGLTATTGNLSVATVNAGSGGTINLTSQGALNGASATLTANTLNLSSGTAIGSSGTPFETGVANVSAQVSGSGGGIYLASTGALAMGTLSANGGDIDISAAGGLQLGAVTGTGAQRYTGNVTLSGDLSASVIEVDGSLTLAGGARTLTGNVHITGTLTGGGFGVTLDGGSGSVRLDGAASGLASLDATGSVINVGSVATTGAQRYQGFTILGGTYTTQGGAFSVDIGSLAASTTIDTGSGAVTFGGTLSGTESLTIHSSGLTRFDGNVATADISTDAAGTLAVNAVAVMTTGAQSWGERLVLGQNLTLMGSSITLSQGVDGTTAGQEGLTIIGDAVLPGAVGAQTALRYFSVSGAAAVNGGSVATTLYQSYGALNLGADTVLDGASVTVTGATNGAHALTVNAGLGTIVFSGGVGQATPLTSLTLNGGTYSVLGGSVTTSGAQHYGQTVMLFGDVVLTGSALGLSAGADAGSPGGGGLTLAGNATLAGNLGAAEALNDFSTGGTLTLGGDVSITAGSVAFGAAVDGAHDLSVTTGDASFSGPVGATTRLGALAIQASGATTLAGAVRAASVSTDAAGTLAIGGGSVNTTGVQTYGERAVLGSATTLTGSSVTLQQGAQGPALTVAGAAELGGDVTTSGAQHYTGTLALGADVALAGTGVAIDGAVNGAHDLTVTAGSGEARFGGAIGNVTRLGAIVIDSDVATTLAGAVRAASLVTGAGGTLAIDGGSVDTTGGQSYGQRAMLDGATTLTGTTVSLTHGAEGPSLTVQADTVLAGSVNTTGAQHYTQAMTLAGDASLEGEGVRIEGAVDGGFDLAVDAGSGNARFDGAIGSSTRLGALTLQSSGATTLGGAVRVTSLTSDAAGTLAIGGGSVHTTGAQTWGERAALDGATTLTGSSVTLQQGAQGTALTVAGATVLGGSVTTSGAQQYAGTLALGTDVTLTGAAVAVDGAADGAHDLTVHAGSGDARFGGTVGATTRLGALTVHTSGATTLAGAVRAASVATDAAGTLAIGGGSVDTTGTQTWGERAGLTAATTLTGSSITLQQGAQGTALTVDGAAVLGSGVLTDGAQHYTGTLALAADLVLTGEGVAIDGAIDGAHNLMIVAGSSEARLGGPVGATTRLGALSIQTSGATTLAGAVRATTVVTDAAGTLAIDGGSVDTTSIQLYGERAVLGGATTLAGAQVTLQQGAQGTALAVSGATVLGGDVTTTGTQTYGGTLDVGTDLALVGSAITVDGSLNGAHSMEVRATAGDVQFRGAIGDGTRVGSMLVTGDGAITFGAAVRAASLTVGGAGTLALDGGSVDTTGVQYYDQRVDLGAATTLTGTTVALRRGAQGPALTVNGSAILVGDVLTAGAQHYAGALTVAEDLALAAEGVRIDGALEGAHDLAVDAGAGDLHIGGTVGATTRLGALSLAGSGATTLAGAVRAASVTTDAAGTLTISGGSVDTTGAQTWAERAVLDGVTTLTGSSVTLQQGAQGTALTVAGATVLGGGVQTTGAQHYAGTLALGTDVALTGAGVAVDGAVEGAHDLAVNAGSGAARFGGTIGATTRLGALTVQTSGATTLAGAVRAASVATDAAGTLTLGGGSVDTTGTQTWGERAVLDGATTLAGSTVTLQQGAQGTALAVAGATVLRGGVTTSGAQHYAGTLALGADVALSGTGVTVDGAVDGAHDLAVDAGTGDARFGSTIGATTRLGTLTIDASGATTLAGAVRAASVATDAAGTLAVNGGSVNTTGTQSYGERALLGSATTLTGSAVTLLQGAEGPSLTVRGAARLAGAVTTEGAQRYEGALTLVGDAVLEGQGVRIDGAVEGGHDLAVEAGAGEARFGGAIGAATRLGALAVQSSGATTLAGAVRAASVTTDAAGTLALDGGSVDTTGAQTYSERALLGSATTLTGSTVTLQQGAQGTALTIAGTTTLGGDVATTGAQQYGGAVVLATDVQLEGSGVAIDGQVDGAHALTVEAGSGNAQFGGAIGSATRLGALTVHASGATTLAGAVRAASVTTDGAGTLTIGGGSVDTTGAQTWGEQAVLDGATTLAGSRVTLQQGATGTALTVAGAATLGGSVATSGAQHYGGTLDLGADLALDGQGVAVDGAVEGAHDLTVNAGSGAARLGGTIGATTRLGALTIQTSGATTLAGAVRAASVATDAVGTLTLRGGSVDTSGTQTYGERAVLDGATTLAGSTVTLQRGAQGTALAVSGATVLGGGVTTSGAQHYAGTLALGADVALRGTGVAVDGAVDGAHDLAVDAGTGNARFGSTIGATTRLGTLTIDASGATTLAGAVRATSVATDAAGTLAVDGGSVNTTGTQTYGERALLGSATTLTGSTVTLQQGADGPALTIAGAAVLGGGVTTAGAQRYAGTLDLAADVALVGEGVALDGAVNGAHDLAVDAGSGDLRLGGAVGTGTRLGALTLQTSGAATLAGTVRAASLDTGADGTLALAGGLVDTTGTQAYGQRVRLDADTTLRGSRVSLLAGADALAAGAQGLAIEGDAVLGGPIGAAQALARLDVGGATTLAAGTVTTTGDQTYGGALQVVGDQLLHSLAGTLTLDGTVDGAAAQSQSASVDTGGRANLTLASDAGAVAVQGAVGGDTALGALTVRAATTLDFGGNIRAYRLHQTVGGASHYLGTVWVDGADGIDLRGASVRFDQAVTATTGALNVTLTDAAGTLAFAASANVATATGFVQSGGAAVLLPSSVVVTKGPITLAAPAYLPAGAARIETEGDITIAGLSGPATELTLAAGHGSRGSPGAGRLLIGLDDGNPLHVLDVARLTVPDAGSAQLFGRIGGRGGALAASLVGGGLVNAPYFANGTPWGPLEVINRLTATTVPPNVVPSTAVRQSLFLRQPGRADIAADAHGDHAEPPVVQTEGDGVNTTGDQ